MQEVQGILQFYILKIVLTIPLKHFGTLSTTIFIIKSPFYHLNRHRYPIIINKISSIAAITAVGKNMPAAIPKEKDSATSPAARVQPLMQMFSILFTSVSF